jgi:hypothetical protein
MRLAKISVLTLTFVLAVSLFGVSQQAPSAPITMKGTTVGAVRFPHSAHTHVAGKCEVCHHLSNPEKPLKSPQEACTDCHTKPPTSAVKIGLPAAFHNPGATAGLCITCHKTQNAEGKAAPVKCADCHKKESS